MVQVGVNVDLIAIHVPVFGTVSASATPTPHTGLTLPCLLWHQSRLNNKQPTCFER
jgi:hypothetical protein